MSGDDPAPAPDEGLAASGAVAVLIAAWNAEATVARAIRSALAQPEVSEVCVVDDSSIDATYAQALSCEDGSGRLLVLRQPVNAGPSAARNVALEATVSPWIAVLDADDYLLGGRFKRLLAISSEFDLVGDALLRTDPDAPTPEVCDQVGEPLPLTLETFALGNLGRPHGPLDLGYLKPLIRREALRRHRLRYNPAMRLGEDYDLYLRILAGGGRAALLPPTGYVSVRTPKSLSLSHAIVDLRRLRDCDDDIRRDPARSAPERRALRCRRSGVERRLQWRLLIEAVKTRDAKAAVATFRSLHVSVYLVGQLLQQLWLRTGRSLGRFNPPRSSFEPSS